MTRTHGTSGPEQPVADPRDYVQDGLILIGCSKSGRDLTAECIELALANRHGLGHDVDATVTALSRAPPAPARP